MFSGKKNSNIRYCRIAQAPGPIFLPVLPKKICARNRFYRGENRQIPRFPSDTEGLSRLNKPPYLKIMFAIACSEAAVNRAAGNNAAERKSAWSCAIFPHLCYPKNRVVLPDSLYFFILRLPQLIFTGCTFHTELE